MRGTFKRFKRTVLSVGVDAKILLIIVIGLCVNNFKWSDCPNSLKIWFVALEKLN